MCLRHAVTFKFFFSDISNSHCAFRLYTGDRMGLSSDTLTHSVPFFSVPLCPTFLMYSESITPWLCIFCPLLFPCVLVNFSWSTSLFFHRLSCLASEIYHQINFDPLNYTHLQPIFDFCLDLSHDSCQLHPFPLPNLSLGFPNPPPSWQHLLLHPPVRVFCCRITLCLLRFVLCSRLITTTGEVTGEGLHINGVYSKCCSAECATDPGWTSRGNRTGSFSDIIIQRHYAVVKWTELFCFSIPGTRGRCVATQTSSLNALYLFSLWTQRSISK